MRREPSGYWGPRSKVQRLMGFLQLPSSFLQTGCSWTLLPSTLNLAANALQECEYEIQNCVTSKGQVFLKQRGGSKFVMFAYAINCPFSPFIKSLLLLLLLLLHGCSPGWHERAEAEAGKGGLCPTAPTPCDGRAGADAREM